MSYIIPKNYNFKPKFLGIIDYPTAIFNLLIMLFDFVILKLLLFSIITKIIIFLISYLPIFLVSIFGFYNENFLYILLYVLKYLISPKVYIYK